MRVLIACEFSGIVREAFRRKGHDAWSCDLLPTEQVGQHIQGDVLDVLDDGWDLMIAHPPCTHLAASGARWWKQKRADGRQQEAIAFFMALAAAPVLHIAIENPIGVMSSVWRKPDQKIQPYEHGHKAQKTTCFWLKNLPLLRPTRVVDRGPQYIDPRGNKHGGAHPLLAKQCYAKSFIGRVPQRQDRWKIRSRTFPGIAEAMADQWGSLTASPAREPGDNQQEG